VSERNNVKKVWGGGVEEAPAVTVGPPIYQ